MSRKPKIDLKIVEVNPRILNTRKLFKDLNKSRDLIKQIDRGTTNEHHIKCYQFLNQSIKTIRELINSKLYSRKTEFVLSTKRHGQVIKVVTTEGLKEGLCKLREAIKQFRNQQRYYRAQNDIIRLGESRHINRNRMAGVHLEYGFYAYAQRIKKSANLREAKKPNSLENHVGIELEFLTKTSEGELALLLTDANLCEYVQLKQDGSISVPYNHNGFEIAVCMPRVSMVSILQRLCGVLQQVEARVNSSCGYHVHLDMRNKSREQMEVIFSNLVSSQGLLLQMLPPSRSKGSHAKRYCRPNTRKDYQNNLDSRYKSINALAYQRYRTLEVRMHSGTVDYNKILNFILILEHICDLPESVKRAARKVNTFSKRFKIPMFLQNYIQERVNKFATSHSNNNLSTEDVG